MILCYLSIKLSIFINVRLIILIFHQFTSTTINYYQFVSITNSYSVSSFVSIFINLYQIFINSYQFSPNQINFHQLVLVFPTCTNFHQSVSISINFHQLYCSTSIVSRKVYLDLDRSLNLFHLICLAMLTSQQLWYLISYGW